MSDFNNLPLDEQSKILAKVNSDSAKLMKDTSGMNTTDEAVFRYNHRVNLIKDYEASIWFKSEEAKTEREELIASYEEKLNEKDKIINRLMNK